MNERVESARKVAVMGGLRRAIAQRSLAKSNSTTATAP